MKGWHAHRGDLGHRPWRSALGCLYTSHHRCLSTGTSDIAGGKQVQEGAAALHLAILPEQVTKCRVPSCAAWRLGSAGMRCCPVPSSHQSMIMWFLFHPGAHPPREAASWRAHLPGKKLHGESWQASATFLWWGEAAEVHRHPPPTWFFFLLEPPPPWQASSSREEVLWEHPRHSLPTVSGRLTPALTGWPWANHSLLS